MWKNTIKNRAHYIIIHTINNLDYAREMYARNWQIIIKVVPEPQSARDEATQGRFYESVRKIDISIVLHNIKYCKLYYNP